jgi:hypothetical protein
MARTADRIKPNSRSMNSPERKSSPQESKHSEGIDSARRSFLRDVAMLGAGAALSVLGNAATQEVREQIKKEVERRVREELSRRPDEKSDGGVDNDDAPRQGLDKKSFGDGQRDA